MPSMGVDWGKGGYIPRNTRQIYTKGIWSVVCEPDPDKGGMWFIVKEWHREITSYFGHLNPRFFQKSIREAALKAVNYVEDRHQLDCQLEGAAQEAQVYLEHRDEVEGLLKALEERDSHG